VCDSFNACSAPATVTLNIVNNSPVAAPDSYTVLGNTIIGPFIANDNEPDEDSYSFDSVVTYPAHGNLYGLAYPTYPSDVKQYAPHVGYNGSDSFTYRICDYLGACATTTVTLQVIAGDVDAGATTCQSGVGDPINVTSGNMYLHQTDYLLPGVGPTINVTRTYNSSIPNVGALWPWMVNRL